MVIVPQMQDQHIIETTGIIVVLHIPHLLILLEIQGIHPPRTPILLHVPLIQNLKIPIATLHTPDLPTLHPIALHTRALPILHPIVLRIPDQVVRQADLLILRQVLVAVPHLHLPVAAVPQEEADNLPHIINH